jgi:hypothetical protein
MPKESHLYWFEKVLKRNSVSYPIVFIVIGAIIWSIYSFLGRMMELDWDNETRITVVLMGIIVAFQLMGVEYLLDTRRNILRELRNLYSDQSGNITIKIEEMPHKLFWYYVLMPAVILPFYLIDWISYNYTFEEYFLEYYTAQPSNWSLLFDIYSDLVGLLILFIFFNIIWILTDVAWTIRYVSIGSYGQKMSANLFAANSRLGAIRDSLLKIVAYYFICVSLIIASYVNFSEHIYETIFLISFLLLGLIFFFIGFEAVNSLMESQVALISNDINEKIQRYVEKLLCIESDGDPVQKNQETNFISNMLDVLQKQRDALAKENTKIYDIRSVFSFLSVFFLPILTDIAKKDLNNIFLVSGDINNHWISIMNSLFTK